MPNSDISCVTSNVSVVPCSISAELPSKVETWKLVQLCLVDAKGRNISKWVHSNGAEWLVSWKQVCHTMTLRLVQGTDHSMGWLPSCPHCRDEPCSFNHTVDSTLEYCNGFGPVCCNSSSPSFEGWTSGSHANALASIDQRPHKRLRLQWSRERRHWHAEWRNVVFSDESRFNMSCNEGHIRVRRYAGERNLRACILQQHRAPTPSVMVWGSLDTICDLAPYVLRAIWTATATLGRFYIPRYCPSFRQLHMSYFHRTMPGHKWQGLCRPSSKDDGYHCFSGLHVRQTCRPSNMSGRRLIR